MKKNILRFKSAITLIIALLFSFGILFPNSLMPRVSAEPDEAKEVTVYVLGSPDLYNKEYNNGGQDNPDKGWALLKTIKLSNETKFKDIKNEIEDYVVHPIGLKFDAYKTDPRKGHVWQDDDPIKKHDEINTFRIYISYERSIVLKYETNGADENPEFKDKNISWEYSPIDIPDAPTKTYPEVGRDNAKFLGWYYHKEEDDEIHEHKFEGADNAYEFWKSLGKLYRYEDYENPLYNDNPELYVKTYQIRPIKLYAKWNEAPLLVVNDAEITAGDEFDLKNMIVSATDEEDGEISADTVTIDGDYDTSKAGEYILTFTLTDRGGLQHKVEATLSVKEKEEKPIPSESETNETIAKPTESKIRRPHSIWQPAGTIQKPITIDTPKPNVVVNTPTSYEAGTSIPATGERSFTPFILTMLTAAFMLFLIRAKKY
ncbi:MAG: bacterial Ig-like domain-containing protein [Eubacteriales bacterium]|nr:bacterial Ig-like domain-containing protein [Eubacteriales bacterium]